jgi:hypothetical protein
MRRGERRGARARPQDPAAGQLLAAIFGPFLEPDDARLTSSRALRDAGREAGRTWAESQAAPEELERLARVPGWFEYGDWQDIFDGDAATGVPGGAGEFHAIVRPEQKEQGETATAFWEQVLGGQKAMADAGAFVIGFAEAAVEFWGERDDKG